WARVTVPNFENASRRSSAVVLKGKLPTYKFVAIVILCEPNRLFQKLRHETSRPGEARKKGSAANQTVAWHSPLKAPCLTRPSRRLIAKSTDRPADPGGLLTVFSAARHLPSRQACYRRISEMIEEGF